MEARAGGGKASVGLQPPGSPPNMFPGGPRGLVFEFFSNGLAVTQTDSKMEPQIAVRAVKVASRRVLEGVSTSILEKEALEGTGSS